jgi:hypothetical protein
VLKGLAVGEHSDAQGGEGHRERRWL